MSAPNVITTCVSAPAADWIYFSMTTGREEILADIEPVDRLKFKDKKRYRDRLSAAQKSTGEKDALIAMRGTLRGMPVVAVAFEFNFHGGSMGYAVGEKFTRAAQLALEEDMPLVCFAASGGARMQEALISLMQMAKTSAVIERMKMSGSALYFGDDRSYLRWRFSVAGFVGRY